jgi:hypothetical protein
MGIDHRFRMLTRVGALAVIWSLQLCINDKVFNDKNSSPLQVIYQCTGTLRLWSSIQWVEHHNLFIEVYARLETTTRDTFTRHGWRHNLQVMIMICHSPFSSTVCTLGHTGRASACNTMVPTGINFIFLGMHMW